MSSRIGLVVEFVGALVFCALEVAVLALLAA
jgi:hypothetical protein